MVILAIDPGTKQSAWVVFDLAAFSILDKGITSNELLVRDRKLTAHLMPLVIEVFKSYGNVMGDSVLNACVWIGRFIQAAGGKHTRYCRREIVSDLCNNPRAGDKHVRQALIDRFEATGGGVIGQIGTAPKPGPLYGVKQDIWAALAVAVKYADDYNADKPFLK